MHKEIVADYEKKKKSAPKRRLLIKNKHIKKALMTKQYIPPHYRQVSAQEKANELLTDFMIDGVISPNICENTKFKAYVKYINGSFSSITH